ncbi:cytochrome P450 [Streptomyces nigrescens]
MSLSEVTADRTRWERLLENPSLVRSTVEEALRFDANGGFGLRRFLTEDVETGGEVLPNGTTVVCAMAAANRDETAFENAAEMDLARTPLPRTGHPRHRPRTPGRTAGRRPQRGPRPLVTARQHTYDPRQKETPT